MLFTLIEGTFHLVGQTTSGNPSGFGRARHRTDSTE
jgi:hypothetical protein